MIGIVDVGGGMRGSYGAGIFDYCLDNNIEFDYLIGVSAGSANMVTFLAGQRGRNYKSYTEYSLRKEYMGVGQFLKTGNFINLEYIYGDGLSNEGGEYPLDYDAASVNKSTFKIVATDALTGKPVYFDMKDMPRNDYGAIKGSSCVPGVNKPYAWRGGYYYDGGISDPIPYQKALDAGCDKVILVLTRPKDYRRKPDKDRLVSHLLGKYPASREALIHRSETYNRELDEAVELEKSGKILILAPDSIEGMSTLKKDSSGTIALYHKGYKDAEAIPPYIA